jgi:hypothetical protein
MRGRRRRSKNDSKGVDDNLKYARGPSREIQGLVTSRGI